MISSAIRWFLAIVITLVIPVATGCGGGSGGGGPDESPRTEVEIQPLPENTFLFMRKIDDHIDHLYLYDLDSRSEQLVTDFDNESVSRFDYSISPDRRWVVFRALAFRLDEADAQAILQEHLWKVGVDGRQFVRLTFPIMPMDESCPFDQPACERERTDPIFSRDGSMIYYSLGEWWQPNSTFCTSDSDCGGMANCINHYCRGFQAEGGSVLARISSQGEGTDKTLPQEACSVAGTPTLSHSGKLLLYENSVCFNGKNGLYMRKEPFEESDSDFIIKHDSYYPVVWTKDDSGFYYDDFVQFDDDQDGRSETHGDCLYIYNFESGESKLLLRPPAGAGQDNNRFNIWGFSPSADQSNIVLSIENPKDSMNLYLLDLETNTLEQLTFTDDAWSPIWFP